MISNQVSDPNLLHTLEFGIGLHHAGLKDPDRELVESLFAREKIQVLVCTSTLAWGVNLPAHLVVIKGTEYFDAKSGRYVDFPITDVLQMMGRAGRPQFDSSGCACILVHEPKKNFYRKFLYEPFPVESSLPDVLNDHFNAEISGGSISKFEDAIDYLSWTFFFRRLLFNPSYYHFTSQQDSKADRDEELHKFLLELVMESFRELEESQCIELDFDSGSVAPTFLGRIASFYYLSHKTIAMFSESLSQHVDVSRALEILSNAAEFDEFPVRHNEDKINQELAALVKLPSSSNEFDSPHVKVNLLFQCRFSKIPLPVTDYVTDTKSALDSSRRIVQAMIDICAEAGWHSSTFAVRFDSSILCDLSLEYHLVPDDSSRTMVAGQHSQVYSSLWRQIAAEA
jgi:activating signal cointegrator complex subunit 3